MIPEVLKTISVVSEKENTANNWNEVEQVTISWNNINTYAIEEGRSCFTFKRENSSRKKHILKDLNGQAFPGSMLAVMGASGSGKSTLLNVLTGRNLVQFSITGSILVNGQKNSSKLAKLTAYVEQDDMFVGSLTVREHLTFQAALRMKAKISYEEKVKRVEQVIREMGLTTCSDNVIGIKDRINGISGGEKKRLSFASEILTNPSVMFCDEVTSGLDSFLSQSVVSVLKGMSNAGRTVICVIHQPSSEIYAMFDRVLFMASGRTAFIGTRQDAVTFFSRLGYHCPLNYNPADYIIQNLAVIPGDEENCMARIKNICYEHESHNCMENLKLNLSNQVSLYSKDEKKHTRYKASWFTQLRFLTWRSLIHSRREPLLLKLRVIQTSMSLILFSIFYWRQNIDERGIMNIQMVMYMILLNTSFMLIISLSSVLCEQMPLFLKEYRSCLYRSDVFFLGNIFSEILVTVIVPIIFTGVLYWTVGLYNDYRAFLICIATVTLCSSTSASFGYFLAVSLNSANAAAGFASALFLPLSLLGGLFVNIETIPTFLAWLKYLSWFYYANEIMNINQWSNIKNITCSTETCPSNGVAILYSSGYDPNNLLQDVALLVSLAIGWRLLAYAILLARVRRWI